MNANRGYVGYSMSVRAAAAYENLEMPKTAFKKHYGINEKTFQLLLTNECLIDSWHHTSKHFNKTNFYAASITALEYMAGLGSESAKFELLQLFEEEPKSVSFPFEYRWNERNELINILKKVYFDKSYNNINSKHYEYNSLINDILNRL